MKTVLHREPKTNESLVSEHEGKYLTFFLCDEEYGIAILKVKEIIGIMNITPVPQSPGYVKGVINLRGKVIPIVDLRLKFGMPEKEHDLLCPLKDHGLSEERQGDQGAGNLHGRPAAYDRERHVYCERR